jgi:hypothetical protein
MVAEEIMTRTILLTTICAALLAAVNLLAQTAATCKAEIASPQQGDRVGTAGDVSGSATVPPGMFLWVFAHRNGLAKWWPQSGGAARVKDGKWVVHATYGDEKDAGANFVITALVVDQKENDDILKYVNESEAKNQYSGTTLPAASSGCASRDVIVKRQ